MWPRIVGVGFAVVRTPEEILRDAKTIALVGASPDPAQAEPRRDGVSPAGRLSRSCPVNPAPAGEVLGQRCLASLAELEEPVDLVDVFRRPEHCGEVAREAAAAGAGALWLQLGVVSAEARRVAEEHGMDFVENECTAIVHRRI